MLCCVVLHCSILCCICAVFVLCCVVLYCAVLCYVVLFYVVSVVLQANAISVVPQTHSINFVCKH